MSRLFIAMNFKSVTKVEQKLSGEKHTFKPSSLSQSYSLSILLSSCATKIRTEKKLKKFMQMTNTQR